jgi:putative transposase
VKTGAFVQDARGHWYVAFQCEVGEHKDCGSGIVGIDLGLKDLAVLSDGTKIENRRHYAKHEAALAVAQRAGNKRRAVAIHAKIVNARKHYLHCQTHRLVMQNRLIAVGNVNSAALAQVMGKSVLDASWSTFRTMLHYKARRHGATYIDADERFTTQTCSACGSRSGPKGRKALGIREWACGNCGTIHDRDVNAAINILGSERRPLAEEMPVS